MRPPNPGSKEAGEQGCTCPVLDNRHGKGAYDAPRGAPVFWFTETCPLHTKKEKEPAE
jgi:hypothetical protein